MKADGLDHPKLFTLAAALECSLPEAVGYLEFLWRFAGKFTPAGDIGKHADLAIARACHWQDDPEVFFNALVKTKWLDADEQHRLIVHDWHDHAPAYVRNRLARSKTPFVNGMLTRGRLSDKELAETRETPSEDDATTPCSHRAHTVPTMEALSSLIESSVDDPSNHRADPADPLEGFPELQAAYGDLQDMLADSLRIVAPRAKTPAPGSKADREARDALARLVRLDGYAEADVIDTLRWLFTANNPDSGFWRMQVNSFAALRKKKYGDLNKFSKIHAARLKAEGSGRVKTETPLDPELIAIARGLTDA